MDSILVWTVLIGVLFLVGLLVFLLDRLQTISNLARFGPPKAYLEKVKKRQQRKLISDARSLQGRNAVSKDGDGEAKGLVGGQANIGDKPAKKPLEGRVLWNILAGKKATKRSEEEIEAIRKEYKIGLIAQFPQTRLKFG